MKNKKGFTLLELLAVIVILGVIMLIAVPAISNVQTNNKKKAAIDNALTVLKGIEYCDTSEESICSTTASISNYVKNTGVTFTRDASTGNFTAFSAELSGYTVSYTGTATSLSALRNLIQGKTYSNFSGNTLSVS